jgi:tetratricopeptide (TPR) repeat protein
MREGRGDLAEARRLRDELDAPLGELHADERSLIQALSSDLYLLEGKRHIDRLPEGEQLGAVLNALPTSFHAQDHLRTLHLLRIVPTDDEQWPESKLAYAFGRCWERLGFPEAAGAFYEFAYANDPRPSYAIMGLEALLKAALYDDLNTRIAGIETDRAAPAPLVMRAAALLFQLTARMSPGERPAAYRRILALVDRAGGDESVLASIRSAGFIARAYANEHLGDTARATEDFDKAVQAQSSDATLVARGLAKARTDRGAALEDFRAALEQGTRLVWPYVYLAHDALTRNDWEAAERFAGGGVDLAATDALRARLLEWTAISAAMLDREDALVTSLFDAAIASDPFDATIRLNATRYTEAHGIGANWELGAGIDIDVARREFEDERQELAA